MHKIIFFTLFLFIVFFTKAQTKHALVVAISDYPTNEKAEEVWKDLSSLNDVEIIKNMLVEQKFNEANTKYLLEKDATPAKLDKAFDELTGKLNNGDIVYFHFSGHGQQIADISSEKRKGVIIGGDEPDGYDEALVLYNAPLKWPKDGKYEGEHHYCDDQLKTKIDIIRDRIGKNGQIVVVIDACHSGTSTRGAEAPSVRGTKVVCAPENWNPKSNNDISDGFGTDFEYNKLTEKGKLVAFFGCKSDQVNNEYKPGNSNIRYGSLTYFLLEGMKKLKSNASYSNLFSEIRKNMMVEFSGKQIPEIEGDNLSQEIFSGTFIPHELFFDIDAIKFNIVFLNDGLLSGVNMGDEIGLFETSVNSPKDAKPIYTGTVNVANPLSSQIKLNDTPGAKKDNAGLYRAFLIKRAGTGAEIKVKLDLKKHQKEIQSKLEPMANIKIVNSDYQYLVKEINEKGPNKGKVIIYVGLDENLPLREMNPMTINGAEQYDSIVNFLKEASKVDLLRKLEINDLNMDFTLKVLDNNKNEIPISNLKLFPTDKNYSIEVKNTGSENFNLKIISISSDYRISVLNLDKTIYLTPESKAYYIRLSVEPPFGTEQIIFLATSESIDLSALENLGTKINTRGELSPLMDFISQSSGGTRSAVSEIKMQSTSIKSLYFETINNTKQ